jgi:hypothetical protein
VRELVYSVQLADSWTVGQKGRVDEIAGSQGVALYLVDHYKFTDVSEVIAASIVRVTVGRSCITSTSMGFFQRHRVQSVLGERQPDPEAEHSLRVVF